MKKSIDYYVSLVSPWTYLGHDRLVQLAEKHQTPIQIFPVNLGAVFSSTGGLPLPKRSPERQAYRLQELSRWRDFLGIELTVQPKYFPANDNLALRLVISQREQDAEKAVKLGGAILRATWAEERNVADPDTLRDILNEQQCDVDQLFSLAESDEVEAMLGTDTQSAIDRGVFGAPSYCYADEIFWGQDRLEFLARKLEAG